MSVFLLHPPNTSPALLRSASRSIDFYQLLADVPIKPTDHSPNADGQTDQADQSQPRWEQATASQRRNKPTNHSPESDRPQPITVELQLNQLPGLLWQSSVETDRQIISLVKDYGGSIQAGAVTNFAYMFL